MAVDHGKKYIEAAKLVEAGRAYSPEDAIEILKKAHFVKFDETVELHLRTGLDPRHADQNVRGVALLPNGLGKPVRVLVFTQGEGLRIAEDAGTDYVGGDDLIKKIEDGFLDFDVSIATPDMMGKVSKLGRILGRRGLMPNPRSGTVVQAADLPRVIRDARKGRVEFRLDRTGLMHMALGKISFDTPKLLENLATLIEAVQRARPAGAKGQYVRAATLTTTMGPGVPLDLSQTLALKAA